MLIGGVTRLGLGLLNPNDMTCTRDDQRGYVCKAENGAVFLQFKQLQRALNAALAALQQSAQVPLTGELDTQTVELLRKTVASTIKALPPADGEEAAAVLTVATLTGLPVTQRLQVVAQHAVGFTTYLQRVASINKQEATIVMPPDDSFARKPPTPRWWWYVAGGAVALGAVGLLIHFARRPQRTRTPRFADYRPERGYFGYFPTRY